MISDRLFMSASPASTAALAPGGTVDITTRVETPAGPVYRRVFYLRLALDAFADALFIADEAILPGVVRYKDIAVGSSGSLNAGSWRKQDGDTVVSLDRPWHIRRVTSSQYHRVALHRVDGDAVSDEPTTSGNTNQDLNDEFVAHQFAVALDDPDPDASLGGYGFQHLTVRSYPTAPRLSLGLPNTTVDGDSPLTPLWREDGEHKSDVQLQLAGANMRSVLLPMLEAVMQDRAPTDVLISIPVVFDSDAPCRFELGDMTLVYELEISGFVETRQKQSLKFDGLRWQRRRLLMQRPPNAIFSTIRMGTHESLQDPPSSTFDGVNPTAAKVPAQPNLGQHQGIVVDTVQCAAVRIDLHNAVQLNGVQLALLPLADDVEVRAVIYRDHAGRPSGETIVVASYLTGNGDGRHWATVRWQDVLLSSGTCWLMLECSRGYFLWLGSAGSGSGVQLFAAEGDRRQSLKTVAPFAAAWQWIFKPVNPMQTGDPVTGPAVRPQPIALSLNGTALSAVASDDRGQQFEFAAAANAEADGGALALDVASATRAIVTVYPPVARYSLSS